MHRGGRKAPPKSSQCLEPCATIRDTQREIWQMTILTSLFDFNEFIRYLALMEAAVEGLAQGHNKWKALISVEWVEKKMPFILVSILLCSFMGRCYKDGGAGGACPISGAAQRPAEWSSGPALTERLPVPRFKTVNASVRLDSWITFRGTGSFTPPWPRTPEEGCGGTPGGTRTRTHTLSICKHGSDPRRQEIKNKCFTF